MATPVTFQEAVSMKIIQKLGKRRQIVIPRDLCEAVGLEEGDFIELQAIDGKLLIKPLQVIERQEFVAPVSPQESNFIHST
jgi:AbrB family looped-hinge helix DNA binding protein